MVSRFLDWLDESAAGIIRVAYLLAGVIAVASYFSDGNVPHWLTHDLDAILPWVLAASLEIHTYLTARRVRSAWQDMQAATLGSDEHERAESSMKLNLWILGGLLLFSMYNQLQFLAANWRPPHTPLTPPGPWAYLIRATITPAAFMCAAFLAPMGEGMAVQVQREAHHLARLAFKAASAQWKRRLRDMQRRNEDVTGALVQLVDDPTERRVIASIHAAMHAAPPALESPAPDPPVRTVQETPDKPPTGPGSPSLARQVAASVRTDDTRVIEMPARQRRQSAARASTKRGGKSSVRTAAERQQQAAQTRTRRLAQLAAWLAETPEIGTRELTRKLQLAEHSRVSESTVNSLRREVDARLNPLASDGQQFAQ